MGAGKQVSQHTQCPGPAGPGMPWSLWGHLLSSRGSRPGLAASVAGGSGAWSHVGSSPHVPALLCRGGSMCETHRRKVPGDITAMMAELLLVLYPVPCHKRTPGVCSWSLHDKTLVAQTLIMQHPRGSPCSRCWGGRENTKPVLELAG